MMLSSKVMLVTALISCFLAVVIGAFGAHAFMPLLIENGRVSIFETANSYHFYHGLGLLFIALFTQSKAPEKLIAIAFVCMFIGLLIFSGSLYILSLTNQTWLGAVTPLGGLFLLLGWGFMVLHVLKRV